MASRFHLCRIVAACLAAICAASCGRVSSVTYVLSADDRAALPRGGTIQRVYSTAGTIVNFDARGAAEDSASHAIRGQVIDGSFVSMSLDSVAALTYVASTRDWEMDVVPVILIPATLTALVVGFLFIVLSNAD